MNAKRDKRVARGTEDDETPESAARVDDRAVTVDSLRPQPHEFGIGQLWLPDETTVTDLTALCKDRNGRFSRGLFKKLFRVPPLLVPDSVTLDNVATLTYADILRWFPDPTLALAQFRDKRAVMIADDRRVNSRNTNQDALEHVAAQWEQHKQVAQRSHAAETPQYKKDYVRALLRETPRIPDYKIRVMMKLKFGVGVGQTTIDAIKKQLNDE